MRCGKLADPPLFALAAAHRHTNLGIAGDLGPRRRPVPLGVILDGECKFSESMRGYHYQPESLYPSDFQSDSTPYRMAALLGFWHSLALDPFIGPAFPAASR